MTNTADDRATEYAIAAQLSWASQLISEKLPDENSALFDSKLLLCHCLGCNLAYLHTWPDKLLSEAQQADFQNLVERRAAGHPVAYLLGYRDFWNLRLQVSDATLIPRPETELLVETALHLPLSDKARVLDLGTGTGAIALALASEKPQWQVSGIDKSIEAVQLARQNAQLNQLSAVSFEQSDWFAQVDKQKFDLIVSNPPYVEANSVYLTQGDVRFEPLSALISGEDGLDDIRLIIAKAKDHLHTGGWLVLEHGCDQDARIRYLFESNSYIDIQTILDLNGLARITLAKNCAERACD